jgi:hypothetical protein
LQDYVATNRHFGFNDLSLITWTAGIVSRCLRWNLTFRRTFGMLMAWRLAGGLVRYSLSGLCFWGIHKAGASTLEVQNQTESEKQYSAFHSAFARIAQSSRELILDHKSSLIPRMDSVCLGMNGMNGPDICSQLNLLAFRIFDTVSNVGQMFCKNVSEIRRKDRRSKCTGRVGLVLERRRTV